MHIRRIGDVQVGAIGLGGMPMSIEGRPEERRAIATIHAALDADGVSPQQVCLAWMLAKSLAVVPIPGASRPETIRDSAAAAHLA
jgi:aryl-alcohol dehydrogenase-like predicted oxidoreductase